MSCLAEHMKHILSFSSSDEDPSILVRENSQILNISLNSNDLNLNFSDDKYCIGYKTDNDEYKPCRHGCPNIRQCSRCAYKDVARVYTVGDFELYPHLKDVLDEQKYVIYLAQFGVDITKVGLTRRSRFMKRWKEQGADLAVAILEFDGPTQAYPAEQYLQNIFGFRNSVLAKQKISRINFDRQKARNVLENAIEKIQTDENLRPYILEESIVDMSHNYPKVMNPEIVGYVNGNILGAKGHWIFFEGISGMHYACNMNSNVGKFLVEKNNNYLSFD